MNLPITLSDLFIQWQVCKLLKTTWTPVSDNALQMFSSKTSSVISAGTGFNSIVSFYWTDHSVVLQLYDPCQYMGIKFFTLLQIQMNLIIFWWESIIIFWQIAQFHVIIIDKAWVDICKFLNELFFTYIFILTLSHILEGTISLTHY